MKALVTVKRVVDPDVKVKLTASGDLDRGQIEYKLNTFDEYAVEEAIRLQEKGVVKEIVVVSVGPSEAEKEIRTALAMGADRGVLVKVDDVEALDPFVVAKLIAGVVEKESPDLIVMGKLAVDSENNQVGQMLAGITGYPQATFAFSVAVDGDSASVGREVDGGTTTVKVRLPAIVTADLRLNEPRYASLPGIMKAKKKPIQTFSPDDLGVDADPKVRVIGYELPPARKAGQMVPDTETLFDKLRNEAKAL